MPRKLIGFYALSVIFLALFAHRVWFNDGGDFQVYYLAGKRALEGAQLYFSNEVSPYKYLPWISYLFIPFAPMSLSVAKFVFLALSFGGIATLKCT